MGIQGTPAEHHAGMRDPTRAAVVSNRLLDAHIPTLTDEIESELKQLLIEAAYSDDEGRADVADLALRECSCGVRIDGFYEYVAHLREVFGLA